MSVPVPEEATRDIDLHDPQVHARRLDEWSALRAQCPVAYNPRHGGYWMVARHEDITRVTRDRDTFSSFYSEEPVDGIDYIGILGIPTIRRPLGIGMHEVEDSLHIPLRRAINPYFSPTVAASMRPAIERYADWFLDQHIESGSIDAFGDLGAPVSALVTMDVVGLPRSQAPYYAKVFRSGDYDPRSPELAAIQKMFGEMAATLLAELQARRENPRGDLLTAFAQFRKPDGEPFTDTELLGQVWFVISGGLETTTSFTSLALNYLAQHPEARCQLTERPELLATATEELLRVFPVNESLTRTVTRDTELGGQRLRRGDHVVISWLSANHDDAVFDKPHEVLLDRAPNPHLAFGTGVHSCIGRHVARETFKGILSVVLRRIPGYVIGDAGIGLLERKSPLQLNVVSLPLRFTPAERTGVPDPHHDAPAAAG